MTKNEQDFADAEAALGSSLTFIDNKRGEDFST
jgi:hypothetical protein